jgi:hypothetical protein
MVKRRSKQTDIDQCNPLGTSMLALDPQNKRAKTAAEVLFPVMTETTNKNNERTNATTL